MGPHLCIKRIMAFLQSFKCPYYLVISMAEGAARCESNTRGPQTCPRLGVHRLSDGTLEPMRRTSRVPLLRGPVVTCTSPLSGDWFQAIVAVNLRPAQATVITSTPPMCFVHRI